MFIEYPLSIAKKHRHPKLVTDVNSFNTQSNSDCEFITLISYIWNLSHFKGEHKGEQRNETIHPTRSDNENVCSQISTLVDFD